MDVFLLQRGGGGQQQQQQCSSSVCGGGVSVTSRECLVEERKYLFTRRVDRFMGSARIHHPLVEQPIKVFRIRNLDPTRR